MNLSAISVIIPAYNHAIYISNAIASLQAQTYPASEIIVVDDGSTDGTAGLMKRFPGVMYLYQSNAGPSAARNLGFNKSTGDYIVFLDADDWLLPNAFELNLATLQQNPEAAFVYGAHFFIREHDRQIEHIENEVPSNHYFHLLKHNFIGMQATVMHRREILKEFPFDETLRGCEDYDLFLRIARKHVICAHSKEVAAYFLHEKNHSFDSWTMLYYAHKVLDKQKPHLDQQELAQLESGRKFWSSFYAEKIYDKLKNYWQYQRELNVRDLMRLKQLNEGLYAQITNEIVQQEPVLQQKIKAYHQAFKLNSRIKRRLLKFTGFKHTTPTEKRISFGDLDRTAPISKAFGYDRGGPIDRYYIENFLERTCLYIKGTVLEIGDNDYTLKYGNIRVTQSEILHIDDTNPKATYTGDLSDAPQLPSNYFDCIILTQTLQLIYDCKKAIATCHRILKPGGYLLITVPGISHIAADRWGDNWFWAFTIASIRAMLSELFHLDDIEVESHGNVKVAAGYLFGLGLPEIRKEDMDHNDPLYPLIITCLARKSSLHE